MNARVLGSRYNETHWLVPPNEGKTDISSAISLTDMQSKKVIALINLLIADVFDKQVKTIESEVEEWTNVIEYFSQLNSMINLQIEFTDEMIEQFQDLAENF